MYGENGILNKASIAKKNYSDSEEKEQISLNSSENYIDTLISNRGTSSYDSNVPDLWTTWLYLGGVANPEQYSLNTLSNQSVMDTVMSNQNSVDYMIKSKEYIMKAVCSNLTSYKSLINNTSTLQKALSDATWQSSIFSSPYSYELNNSSIKVPTMTSNTSPSGLCFSNTPYNGSYNSYMAFDNNSGSDFAYIGNGSAYIGYKFTTPVYVYKFELIQRLTGSEGFNDATLYYSDDGTNYTKASDTFTLIRSTSLQSYSTYLTDKHLYWKIVSSYGYGSNGGLNYLQFYGR